MEEILQILGAEEVFDNNGDLTTGGADAYEKLASIIELLNCIGIIHETLDECEKRFDEIIRLGF